jgi:hypothetical protein
VKWNHPFFQGAVITLG